MRLTSLIVLLFLFLFTACDDSDGLNDPLLTSWILVDEVTVDDGVETSTLGEYEACYAGDVFRFYKKKGFYSLDIDSKDTSCDTDPDVFQYNGIEAFFEPETNLIRAINMPLYVEIPLHPVLYNLKGGILTQPTLLTVQEVDKNTLELTSSSLTSCSGLFCTRILRFERGK